jgi:hypothetical protein
MWRVAHNAEALLKCRKSVIRLPELMLNKCSIGHSLHKAKSNSFTLEQKLIE